MTPQPVTAPGPAPASTTELELHASVESLQAEVRALADAIASLCRALEIAVPDVGASPEAAEALEKARLCVGKIW